MTRRPRTFRASELHIRIGRLTIDAPGIDLRALPAALETAVAERVHPAGGARPDARERGNRGATQTVASGVADAVAGRIEGGRHRG